MQVHENDNDLHCGAYQFKLFGMEPTSLRGFPLPKLCDQLLTRLADLGIKHTFTVPSDDPDLHKAIERYTVPIVMRDERGAAFAAQIYARLRGSSLFMTSHGPGMTNAITGLAAAWIEQDPVIAIVSQLPLSGAIAGAHAYVPSTVIKPVTTQHYEITGVDMFSEALGALEARTHRADGPIAIVLPQDVSRSHVTGGELIRRERPTRVDVDFSNPFSDELASIALHVNRAKSLFILVGAQVIRSGACEEFRELVRLTGAKVLTTLHAKGIMIGGDEDCVSRHNLASHLATSVDDCCLSIGVDAFEGLGQIVSVCPVLEVSFGLVGSLILSPSKGRLRLALGELVKRCAPKVIRVQDRCREIAPTHAVEKLARSSSEFEGPICVDTGLYKHAWATYGRAARPNHIIFNNGLSSIGWSLGAAIGAHFATGKHVIAVTGDGSLSMSSSELFTILQYDLPISIILIEDDAYGMIQRLELERTGSVSSLTLLSRMDYKRLAEVFGFSYICLDELEVQLDLDTLNKRRCFFHLATSYKTYEFSHH